MCPTFTRRCGANPTVTVLPQYISSNGATAEMGENIGIIGAVFGFLLFCLCWLGIGYVYV